LLYPITLAMRLSSIDGSTKEAFTLTSPRSVEACERVGVLVQDLHYLPEDQFLLDAAKAGFVEDVGRGRFKAAERKRLERLRLVQHEYKTLCMSRWLASAQHVLADLSVAVDKFIYIKQGIYGIQVAKELKMAIAVEGRRYLRYPTQYAKAEGQPEPGIQQVVKELHRMIKAVVERDELLVPITEWDDMVENGCSLRPKGEETEDEEGKHEATCVKFEEILRRMAHLFPNISEEELEEAARQGLVLDSEPSCSFRLGQLYSPAKMLSRATTASLRCRSALTTPALSISCCAFCGGGCRQSFLECPRCKSKTYCSYSCRQRGWDQDHEKECVDLQPAETHAANLARKLLHSSDTDPGNPDDTSNLQSVFPPVKWSAYEAELRQRCSAQDWSGIIRMQPEFVFAGESLAKHWPNFSLGIFNTLSDCYKAMGRYNEALDFLKKCEDVAKSIENRAMEAQVCLHCPILYAFVVCIH
jgi:hypothetical protein